jgi:hypothetical protein
MWLILSNTEAEKRNTLEATNHGCKGVTKYWWPFIVNGENTAINVGDGKYLNDTELSKCVSQLPEEFQPKTIE